MREFVGRDFFSYRPSPGEPGADDVIHGLAIDLRRAMSDLAIEIDERTETADGYRARITVSGTHDGPLWGAPATGHRMTWPVSASLRRVGDRFALTLENVETPAIIGLLRDLDLVNSADQMDQPPKHPFRIPDVIIRLLFTGQMADKPCAHVDQIQVTEPKVRECASCVAAGDIWPPLRMCLACGFVGCCDTSKNRHMKAHHEASGHPFFRSIRLEEDWMWCYEDNAFFEPTRLAITRATAPG